MSSAKPSSEEGLTYRDAGVDIDAANRAMGGISALLKATRTEDTLSDLGVFGGLYRVPRGLESPVLVASTDGVGTKLKIAFLTGRHDTVGEDLVNHCVNDILVQGARPLFFLDYIGLGRLEPGTVEALVEGIARGCRANGCALLGGETAEMPDFYAPGEYDLAGTIVGIVEEARIVDGSGIRAGDVVIALASSGLHTNGYSLARRIVFERLGLGVSDPFPEEGESVGEVLLRVHRSYLRAVRPLLEEGRVRGMAHVTGGGLVENLPRVLPEGVSARIDRSSWEVPPLFRVLQEAGRVETAEMFRAFNMGVGMVVVVRRDDADAALAALGGAGERAWVVGEITPGDRSVDLT
jgi:phosphoribosylformylglycinamidine cyclo-ligase